MTQTNTEVCCHTRPTSSYTAPLFSASTKVHCLVTETHRCEQLGHINCVQQNGQKSQPATSLSEVQCSHHQVNYYNTKNYQYYHSSHRQRFSWRPVGRQNKHGIWPSKQVCTRFNTHSVLLPFQQSSTAPILDIIQRTSSGDNTALQPSVE